MIESGREGETEKQREQFGARPPGYWPCMISSLKGVGMQPLPPPSLTPCRLRRAGPSRTGPGLRRQ